MTENETAAKDATPYEIIEGAIADLNAQVSALNTDRVDTSGLAAAVSHLQAEYEVLTEAASAADEDSEAPPSANAEPADEPEDAGPGDGETSLTG